MEVVIDQKGEETVIIFHIKSLLIKHEFVTFYIFHTVRSPI